MSDDHGHDAGHGHDSNAPADIIPLGSWQDMCLGAVSIFALVCLCGIGSAFLADNGIKVPAGHEAAAEHEGAGEHAGAAEHEGAAAEH